jgi:hypothetical protein
VFKANNKDFSKIIEMIEEQFPDVELLYATTAPIGTFLHVSKSVPFEMQDSSIKPYTFKGR